MALRLYGALALTQRSCEQDPILSATADAKAFNTLSHTKVSASRATEPTLPPRSNAAAVLVAKHLALPVPWMLAWRTRAIEDMFVDGVFAALPSLRPCEIAYAVGAEDTAGLKTWMPLGRDGLITCIVTDAAWSGGRALRLLLKLRQVSKDEYERPDFLLKHECDSLDDVTTKLADVKEALQQSIVAVLNRGTQLDEMIAKSQNLSEQALIFQRQAKKTRGCCPSLWA